MPGLLDMGDDTSNGLVQLGGLLMSGTSPFFGVNAGNAMNQYTALQQQKRKEDRADAQAELAQLVQSYKVLKDQDQLDRANAAYDNTPYTPNPLLSLHEQKLSQLLGGSFKTPQSQPAPVTSQPSVQQSTLPASVASQYSPVVNPGFQAQGPMPQAPIQPPQQNVTLRMATQAANIPDAVARSMIAQGKSADLMKMIGEALAPKNGPAGLSRINPATGQMEIIGGNAAPGTVPFTRNAAGQLVAQPIQGAAEEVARAEGLKAGATEQAKAPYSLIDVPMSNGATAKMPLAQFLARQGGAIPQSVIDADRSGKPFNATMTPDGQVSFDQPASLSVTQPPRPGSGASFGVSQTPGAKTEQEGLAKQGVDYKTALDTKVAEGNNFMSEIRESKNAIDQFQPGMGANTRMQVARFAKDVLGAGPDLVNKINQGDLSAKQEFEKLAAKQAMDSLRQSLAGGSRMTQAEFKIFLANNPNIALEKGAIDRIFTFAQNQHLKSVSEQAAMNNYVQNGGKLSDWPAVWTQMQLKQGNLTPMGAPQSSGFRYVGKVQ